MRIGFLGTGLMGAPMVRRLLLEGHDVQVWNRSPEKAEALTEHGARVAHSPAELGRGAELLVCMLSDARAVAEVLLEREDAPALQGHSVLQMGTVAPDENRYLARRIADRGGEMLEAPVLGSVPQARRAELIVMGGGSKRLFHGLREVLTAFGPHPRHVGEMGKAAALKLALNHLIAAQTTAFSLSLGLVRRTGIELGIFLDILRASALYAPTFDKKLDLMLQREFQPSNFPAKHLLKDVRLVQRVAEEHGLNADVVEALERVLHATVESGHGDEDYASLYLQIDPEK